jgi:hypothetical protein
MTGSVEACAFAVKRDQPGPSERGQECFVVLARDAANGFAASDLLLARRSTSSQLLENLNASIHRCVPLTDPFLISEETNIQGSAAAAQAVS